ncbi:MAG: FkbM family methyltransferase [Cyclobacteriaceae bacterium]|nr:FkbM family methyltransferase [Cyclobacteriaceae bacterium]
MVSVKKAINVLTEFRISKMLLGYYWKGYFDEMGWIQSFKGMKPVDRDNNPIPWVTYSFIYFIRERLKQDQVLLEYGSGNSTLFYSKYVKKVFAVEHEQGWHKEISSIVKSNARVDLVALNENGAYSKYAQSVGEPLDIIIVDGRDRVNCLKNGVDSLTQRGIMILDDSERKEYKDGIEFMMSKGFKKIDFWGIAPGIFFNKATTVFYRTENCLGL